MLNSYFIQGDIAVIFVKPPPNTEYGQLKVIVDVADIALIARWPGTWYSFIHNSNNQLYFRATKAKERVEGYSQNQPLLHRVISKPQRGYNTIHIDGNTLNCRHSNLVNVLIGKEYVPPTPLDPRSLPIVRGVHYRPEKDCFECAAFHKGKKYYLGVFQVDAYEDANRTVTEFRALGPDAFFRKYKKEFSNES